jgi:hypothetical protein
MTPTQAIDHVHQIEPKPRRRDWILLPMLGILTIVFLAGSVELIARWMFPQLGTGAAGEDCMVFNDPSTGARGIPNCKVMEKIAEGELLQYRFNNKGFRSDEDFGPKKPGTYRIVMLGTSMTMGMRVPIEKTFASLLPPELSRRTRLKVELYNEAMAYRTPDVMADHFGEVLKADPDMVLWTLTIGDLGTQAEAKMLPISDRNSSYLVRAWHRVKEAYAAQSSMDLIRYIFRHTRTCTLLTHYLYSSKSQFVRASVMRGIYMSELNMDQKRKLQLFDRDYARMEAQAEKSGVLLVVALLPDHAEADMLLTQDLPPDVDPYKFGEELRSIVASHGGTYVDIFSFVRSKPDLQYGYFNAEGHLNALGHAILNEAFAQVLTNGSVRAFKAVAQPQSVLNRGR